MRNSPRMVDLVVLGSPAPSAPVDTNVAYTGLSPSYIVSDWYVIDTSIHFVFFHSKLLGPSFGTSKTATSSSCSQWPSFVS